MLLRLARVYEEETREVDKAIATFKRVAEAEPDRKDGLVALDRLYTMTERWQDLADIVRREIRLADTEDADRLAHLPPGADPREWRWATCPRPSRPTRRSSASRPRTRRRARRSSG